MPIKRTACVGAMTRSASHAFRIPVGQRRLRSTDDRRINDASCAAATRPWRSRGWTTRTPKQDGEHGAADAVRHAGSDLPGALGMTRGTVNTLARLAPSR